MAKNYHYFHIQPKYLLSEEEVAQIDVNELAEYGLDIGFSLPKKHSFKIGEIIYMPAIYEEFTPNSKYESEKYDQFTTGGGYWKIKSWCWDVMNGRFSKFYYLEPAKIEY